MTAYAACRDCAWSCTQDDSDAERMAAGHTDETGHKVDITYLGDRR